VCIFVHRSLLLDVCDVWCGGVVCGVSAVEDMTCGMDGVV
jgi:hypothetical protein